MCTYGWVLSYFNNNKGPAIRTYNSEVVVVPQLYGTDGAYLYCTVFPYTPSKRRDGVPIKKRRKTAVRVAGQFFAKIRVTRLADERVRIERYGGSPDHHEQALG